MTAPIWTTCPDHDVDHLSDERCPMCDLVAEVVKWRRRATDPDAIASRPEVQAMIAAAYEVAAGIALEALNECLQDALAQYVADRVYPAIYGGKPAEAIAALAARDAQLRVEGRVAGLREGYLLGFMASGEGHNGEHPFDYDLAQVLGDEDWRNRRDATLADISGAGKGTTA